MPTDNLFEDLQRLLAAAAASPGNRMPAEVRGNLSAPAPQSGADELAARLAEAARLTAPLSESPTPTASGAARTVARAVADRASETRSPWKPSGLARAVSPLISGLVRLFRSRRDETPAPVLTPFALPEALQVDAGFSRREGGAVREVTRGSDAAPRLTPQQAAVTINVQAIDSRSFLDHSDSIARAVREAMLNTHALNDVVNDL